MNEPREYTVEECRQMMFDHIVHLFKYWRDISEKQIFEYGSNGKSEVHARMEGMLHSLFVMFDGGSGEIPAFNLLPSPHPSDEIFLYEEGENWWPTGVVINDTQLHEIFPWKSL